MSYDVARLAKIYEGSNGDETKQLYAWLVQFGPAGAVATNLFRAHKNSGRAKVYRGSRYKSAAYDTKQWAMGNLCAVLGKQAEALGIVWGWRDDDRQAVHRCVLYVELPDIGQVSFHTAERLAGPGYPKPWDGKREVGAERIIEYILRLQKSMAVA
jgi:hypothetical protein